MDPDQNQHSICPDVDLNYLSADNLKFANSLDPDQNRQSIGPDVYRNHLSVITFANSLDPDQNRQSVGPDVDRNHLSADNLCKQFGSRSEPREHRP